MKLLDLPAYLRGNSYPGRGIVLGRSPDNRSAVIAYFIMGRSENSRNRIFSATEDGIRTEAFDPSRLSDPSLIIYRPLRKAGPLTVVSNGDQTDTIVDAVNAGHCFRHALNTRTFEPDAPHYTPRISGILLPNGAYKLSILKSFYGNPDFCCRCFYEYDGAPAGQGHLLHTYMGDGCPLPSFEGEPRLVGIPCSAAAEFAALLWDSLNEENRISLFVRYVNLETQAADDVIINRHQRSESVSQ